MKEGWINLSLREKQMISVGCGITILLLFYVMLWALLTTKIMNMRHEVAQNQALLIWMQQADEHLQQSEKTAHIKSSQPVGSWLSTLQAQINQGPLAQHVTQLRQADNNSVQLNVQKADFDQLIVFLTTLWKQYHLVVTQLTLTPDEAPGEVSADLQLGILSNFPGKKRVPF